MGADGYAIELSTTGGDHDIYLNNSGTLTATDDNAPSDVYGIDTLTVKQRRHLGDRWG
jgi:hypothetical protein